ncbi:hypothetical protein ACFFGH_11765 [Lysobacter korlensis]|uniref:Squalene cyclase n=1 Tax=Lysobacter korlensis TaxID=553636 RepID=A0ABV6RNE3_9GAMM
MNPVLEKNVLDWLLDSDPSIRWQVMRDVTDAPPDEVAAERARVAREGWGARLLELQDESGTWAGDVYNPPYRGVTFTLDLLQRLGIDPAADETRRAIAKVHDLRADDWGGDPFFAGETEPCVNGRILGEAAYFGELDYADRILERLLADELGDGGWNCEAPGNSNVSSFDTTICVLEGYLDYENAVGATPAITEARRRGEEYMLERRLFRRKSTGEIIDKQFVNFGFPPQYFYDVLRGLEYFRASGRQPEERMREAIDLVRDKRQEDGRWLLDTRYREWGGLFFTLDEEVGEPSRWNTLRALRVLRWAERGGF